MKRALLAATLLVLALAALAAVAWSTMGGGPGDAGEHDVLVVGPEGTLYDGRTSAPEATALSLLQATGLDVEVETYPGMGAFVRAIEGHAAQGGAGWIYEVDGAPGDRSPAERALAAGERLAWRWSAAG